jgi:hypothetical protein
MKTEDFILSITFSYLGASAGIPVFLGTTDFEVETVEFEGTHDEHSSGIVKYTITVNEEENALYVLNDFIKEKGLKSECFDFMTLAGTTILTEDEYNSITFY